MSRTRRTQLLGALIRRVPTGRLARNTIYTTVGLFVRAVIQAGYLILLSRRMGPHDYGLFAGSVAAAVLLAPLSGWGVSYVLTQWISRDPRVARSLWATALVQIGVSGAALIAIVMATSLVALSARVDTAAMLMLAAAELVALPVAQVATTLCVAQGRGAIAATLTCLVPASRLAAVLVLVVLGLGVEPGHVAAFHFIGSLIGALLAIGVIMRTDGAPAWHERLPARTAMADGSRYAIGTLVGTSYTEIDKVLLLQLAGAATAGTYTAAFRVMAVLVLPISALASNALPRLFAAAGRDERMRVLRAVARAVVFYGTLAVVAANVLAPFMPNIFGASFSESSTYLRLLSGWSLVFALHQCAAIGLTGAGRQWARICIESCGIVLVVAINLVAIPQLGGRGSALALLAAETFMAVACWVVLRARAGFRAHAQ